MPQFGQIKTYDADHLPRIPGLFDASTLEECSTVCLAEINRRVEETRRAKHMTREEQRTDLRQTADRARGYPLYRENDNDSLSDGYKVPEGTTAVATDRTVPMAESVKPLFVDPRTGTYFTRTALREIARTDIQRFRILMRNDNRFLNELLAQAN
jgi:hypothetical protein